MEESFYLPVLKTKQGEFDGLEKLDGKIKKKVVPLFEVTPKEWDNEKNGKPKSIEEHINNVCKRYLKKWPQQISFIDTYMIDNERPGGKVPTLYIVNILTSAIGTKCIPILRLNSLDHIIGAVKLNFRIKYTSIGVRVLIEDITDPEFAPKLESLSNKVEIGPADIHLILDLQNSDFSNIDDFSDGILDQLEAFPNFNKWKTFTICGGAFPETGMLKTGINNIARNDWTFFLTLKTKLANKEFDRPINYGDYSIVAPGYFEFDPTKMQRSANIRYTADKIWYVIKGKALKDSEDFKQYINQATQIVKSQYYMGSPFSAGDLYLKNCSDGLTKTGNPTVWKKVGHNHHFTKIVTDLYANSFVA